MRPAVAEMSDSPDPTGAAPDANHHPESIPCEDGSVLVPMRDDQDRIIYRRAATAADPWTVTLCWTEQQNAGRVSVMPHRSPVTAIWGQLAAGEDPDAVAADYQLNPTEVRVLDVLRRDAADHLTPELEGVQ